MSFAIPEIQCSISIEIGAANGSVLRKSAISDAKIILARNQQGDCVLRILDAKTTREAKRFTLTKNRENFRLNTKFVSEGKSSILFADINTRVFISNCPPNDLALFLRGLTLKCNYYSGKNNENQSQTFNTKAVVNQPKTRVQEISPLTTKDLLKTIALKDRTNASVRSLDASPVSAVKSVNKRKLDMILEKLSESSPKTKKKMIQSLIPSPVRGLKILNSNTLTEEQTNVLRAILRGQSLFFTGSAGTGKSYLLKFIISRLPPETTFVTASTGIAACNINGITLHMFSGIPSTWLETSQDRKLTAPEIASRLMKNEAKAQRWRNCKCLIVDEVSMVGGDYFEMMDQVARIIRRNEKPFGGIQVVLCGDFLQLPPITKKAEKKFYAFQTKAWTELIKQYFELRQIKRQSDSEFIKVLQFLRCGKITDTIKSTLIKTSQNNLRRNNVIPTQIYTHRCDVESTNRNQLQKLNSKSVFFNAEDSDATYCVMLDTLCPTPRKLELKIGAQVMLNKNIDVARGLVNGLTGTVVNFEIDNRSKHGVSQRHLPRIRFINGVECLIEFEKWSVLINSERQPIWRKHLPLQLAWALSVHKSQGMTITSGVEISLAKVFESGQAYVALSRATSLQNIKIIDFNTNNIIVDPEVLSFYRQLKYIN